MIETPLAFLRDCPPGRLVIGQGEAGRTVVRAAGGRVLGYIGPDTSCGSTARLDLFRADGSRFNVEPVPGVRTGTDWLACEEVDGRDARRRVTDGYHVFDLYDQNRPEYLVIWGDDPEEIVARKREFLRRVSAAYDSAIDAEDRARLYASEIARIRAQAASRARCQEFPALFPEAPNPYPPLDEYDRAMARKNSRYIDRLAASWASKHGR